MQCHSTNLIYSVLYTPLENRDEQGEKYIAVNDLDKITNLNWRDELQAPIQYFAYRRKLIEMLIQFGTLADGHLRSIRAEKL